MKTVLKKITLVLSFTSLVAMSGILQAGPCENQPNMKRALMKLNEAQSSLQKATPNKKGHRARAIEQIKNVKNQIQMGCKKAGSKYKTGPKSKRRK